MRKNNRYIFALFICSVAFTLLALSGCGSDNTATTAPTTRPSPSVNTGLPDDIPIYPGAQLVGSTAPGQASFQMPGSPQAISSYYQNEMPEYGWKIDQVQDNGADGILLAFSKAGRTAHFAIAPGASARQTTVLITVSSN